MKFVLPDNLARRQRRASKPACLSEERRWRRAFSWGLCAPPCRCLILSWKDFTDEKEGVSPEHGGLRVGVQGGGCSGLSYAMRLDTQARDRDKIFEEHGARIFVDPKSFLYLNGTTLEYEETLMRQGFVFQNPNAARNCGCGSSFTA